MICPLIDLGSTIDYSQDFRSEVLTGLSQKRKRISPKFFYDQRGSELFEQICAQPEYYPTRTEKSILEENLGEITELLGTQATLIEFGSGASVKTRLLLDALADPCAYVPIDISRDFLIESAQALSKEYRGLPIMPVWADYTRALTKLEREFADHSRKVLFFPGSTVGNMEPEEVKTFFNQCGWFLNRSGQGGRFLIGFDLVKPAEILDAAYNDRAGVTAKFNLNLLERMNRELGGDFDLSQFRHHAFFNSSESRVEMHLMSQLDQIVRVAGRTLAFGAEETIHTECSYKYTIDSFCRLADTAGFSPVRVWTDPKAYFAVALFESRGALQMSPEQSLAEADGVWRIAS